VRAVNRSRKSRRPSSSRTSGTPAVGISRPT
jgi:hypothetical protein